MAKTILGRSFIPLMLLFIFPALLGCREVGMSYRVALGNYAYARGEYQDANYHFYSVWEATENPVVGYNLGTVFYALGEMASANEIWEKIPSEGQREYQYRLTFNKGVLAYRAGEYRSAYENFKKALSLSPGSIKAKVNLEHTLSRMNSQVDSGGGVSPAQEVVRSSDGEIQRILEYFRRNESIRPPDRELSTQSEGGRDW